MPASNVSAQLTYQICPIILVGGIASQVPSGMLPMLNLFTSGGSQVNPSSLGSALILPFNIGDLDDAFGAFNVVPGGQLVLQQIGKYPFANQSVAANAVIREPLTLSVLMDTPMRGANPWRVKNQVFTALKSTLDAHNNAGGTYTVATPAFIYENLVMTSLTDISRAVNTVPQNAWRFDFEKPLVSLTELQGAMNFLTNQLTQGLATNGSNTGTQVGATQAQPAQMGQTFKIGGALTGGPPSIPVSPPVTVDAFNFPATVPSAAFPFGGIQ